MNSHIPDRIWVNKRSPFFEGRYFEEKEDYDDIEYIRADRWVSVDTEPKESADYLVIKQSASCREYDVCFFCIDEGAYWDDLGSDSIVLWQPIDPPKQQKEQA